jgi:Rrf2 family protein
MLLAKILQTLKKNGLLESTQGAAGGYALARRPDEVSLLEFLGWFEEQTALVECMGTEPLACALVDVCEIRSPLHALNELLVAQLRNLTLAQVLGPLPPAPGHVPGEGRDFIATG